MTTTRNIAGMGMALIMLAACQDGPIPTAPAADAGPTDQAPVSAVSAGITGSASGSAHLTAFPPPTPPGLATRNFTFNVKQFADGTTQGQWQLVAGGSILHGSLDCLTIAPDGKSARISGVVEGAKVTTFEVGTAFAMEIFDNGDGASGEPDVTTQLRAFRNAPPEVGTAFCVSGTIPDGADLDPRPTENGNLTIQTG